MSTNSFDFLEYFFEEIAQRVAAKLAKCQPRSERIPLSEVTAHGALSPRWVTEQARAGRIVVRGPRGARYVDAAELADLVASTTIRRRHPPPSSATSVEDAAKHAVADLARRRAS